MGNNESKRKKQWSVATLNFGGITHSPFEFYSGTRQEIKQLKILSEIFDKLYKGSEQKIVKESQRNNVKVWNLSTFDKCMQRQRYSPLYRKDVGIANGYLMSRKQFEKRWDQELIKNEHYVKFNKPPQDQQKEDCKLFDFLIFKTFVEYIYRHDKEFIKSQVKQVSKKKQEKREPNKCSENKEPQSQEDKKLDKQVEQETDKEYSLQDRFNRQSSSNNRKQARLAVLRYKEFMDSHFSKPFLKLDIKLERVRQIFKNNDILFLQDASDELLNRIKNQGNVNIITTEGSDCAILVKQSFNKIYDEKKIFQTFKSHQVLKEQRFNYTAKKGEQSTVICFVDRFILINIHLSSNDDLEQITKFMQHFVELNNQFEDLHIIAGGDFNAPFILSEAELKEKYKKDMQQKQNKELKNIKKLDHQKVRRENKKTWQNTIKNIHGDYQRSLKKFTDIFQVYPHEDEQKKLRVPTTIKTRTRLQSQNHKAGKKDQSCRDFLIISKRSLQMSNPQIYTLGQSINTQDNSLLTEQHPFDHLILSVKIKLKL